MSTLHAATTTSSATPQQQALNALGGFSFTIFQSRNNIVLFHSNKLTPTTARKHYPIVEEIPQKRLEQLAFRSAQGGCVIDAAMHAHGAPWIVVVEPVYIGGNSSATTTTTTATTCNTTTPTKVVSTPSKNGGTSPSPSSPQPTNMNVGNANTTTTTSAGRQLKYFRVILVSSFAINVAERQDSMQVLHSAAAIVMTLKCGNTLRTLLAHPQVLRHMSNYVLEFGVKSTLDWREAIILGNTSRDTVTKIHADPRAAELFDKLQSTFYSLIALTAFIPAPPLPSTSTTPPPSSKKQGGGGSSSQANNAASAAAATTHSIGAARVPSLSSKNLTTIVDGDRSFPTLKLDALYADMQQFHAQGPSSPSSSTHRGGGASQQPLPPPPPLSTGGTVPLNGNKWFHRALLELQQYDAGFLSSVVSGVLSLSKRFSDVDGTSARSTLSAKAKAQGAGSAYHEFWVHEQRLHEKELRDRRKARRSGSRPSAAAAPAAAAVGNLGESQPPSMRDEEDDDGMGLLNNSSFGGTGTQPATRVTTPAATPTKSAPPSELNAVARGGSTAAAQRSIYHHPPFPFSYQRTNTRLYGGGGAAREEEEALGPNACGSAAPGHGLRVSASHAGSIDLLDPFSQPAAEAHAQSLQPTSVLYGSPSAPAPQKHKLVASSLMANSEMYLDAMDPSSTSSPTTNKPRATSAFFGATTNHDDSAAKAIFANNTPEARIFVFTRDVTMARNLLAICSFFYCHQHPYVDLDDALRSSTASLNRCPNATESSQIGNLMGHAAFPGTSTDTLALTPTLPIVWVPEEWSQRFPMEQLTHRLSPDTHILVIVPRMQVVERLHFNKYFSTRDIALERRQNGTLVKQLPYGLSNGCFYAELVRQDAVVANKFVTSTIQRALRVESRSKGVLSASSYLEEWMGILLQQVVVFVTENATSGRCTAAVAEAVLQASTRGSPSHRAGSPAAAAALAPQQHLQAPKPRQSNMSASGGGGGGTNGAAGDTASKRNILTSTHSTTTSFSNGDNNPASHTMPAVAGADALSIFNRDLQGLLMCTEVDISHVQLLNFLAEL